jgi:hypothetical protein
MYTPINICEGTVYFMYLNHPSEASPRYCATQVSTQQHCGKTVLNCKEQTIQTVLYTIWVSLLFFKTVHYIFQFLLRSYVPIVLQNFSLGRTDWSDMPHLVTFFFFKIITRKIRTQNPSNISQFVFLLHYGTCYFLSENCHILNVWETAYVHMVYKSTVYDVRLSLYGVLPHEIK